MIEAIKIKQGNSALFYFDQQHRQDILSCHQVTSATEAYNLIKH